MTPVETADYTSHRLTRFFLHFGILASIGTMLLAIILGLQQHMDRRIDRSIVQIDELAQLPRGEYLKAAMLGYHHLGADILWLRLLQVIGERRNTENQYEWMYHTLDVITTLDPQYAYAYYVGGVILGDYAHRPDLSNRLLAKGVEANPTVWNLPFLLGYNYYFLMGDAVKAANYIMRAASLPDGPLFLPGLATRMAAEGGKPETALVFLEARLRETNDPEMQEFFRNRMKEVIIERDLRNLETLVQTYLYQHRILPTKLMDLVLANLLPALPTEPFGGSYILDLKTGIVSSSTHPNRLRTFNKRQQPPVLLPQVRPSYVFPKAW